MNARAALLLAIPFSLFLTGCKSKKAQADELCNEARRVSADKSIAQEDKFKRWVERASETLRSDDLRNVFAELAKMGEVSPQAVETGVSTAIGEPWECGPLAELMSDY